MIVRYDLLQPVDIGGQLSQGFQTGKSMVKEAQTQNALAAFVQNPDDPMAQNALAAFHPQFAMQLAQSRQRASAAQAERERMGSILSTFDQDPAAARRQALEGGDIGLAKQLSELGADQQKRLRDMYKGAAPLAYEAMKLPYEQRKAYIESLRPQLGSLGWSDQQIAGFDPTDANLGGIVQSSMTLEQAMGRDDITYKEVGPGARLVPFDATGRPVSGTGQPQPIDNPSSAAPADTGGEFSFDATPGAKVTSGYRTPEHNREVGGVPNSYHTRRDASGNPMARDFVPPEGMSMTAFASDMRRRNPHLDVINEGDHVHIEPKAEGGNNATIRQQAQEAIAAGADPEAVKARARSMGVSL